MKNNEKESFYYLRSNCLCPPTFFDYNLFVRVRAEPVTLFCAKTLENTKFTFFLAWAEDYSL